VEKAEERTDTAAVQLRVAGSTEAEPLLRVLSAHGGRLASPSLSGGAVDRGALSRLR
jgi:hypothetical protein